MGSYFVLICPYASLCVLMGPYWFLSVLINPSSPCASLSLLKCLNGVLISPYLSLWIPRGFYGSLCVSMPPYRSLKNLMRP